MKIKPVLFGGLVPLAWCAATVAPFLLHRGRLPDPLATHWSFGGAPNGSMPVVAAMALDLSIAVLAAIGAFLAIERWRSGTLLGVATFVGLLLAGTSNATIAANLHAATWRDAAPISVTMILGLASGAAVIGALVGFTMRASVPLQVPTARATIGLGPKERAAWSATARNRGVLAIAAILLGAAVISMLLAVPPVTAIVLFATAILAAAFSEVRVQVGEAGVVIAFGAWHFPRMTMPLSRISEARAIEVRPMANGGWGYRGSLSMTGRAAVVVRRGEGMELRVDGTKTLVVTVDDAQTAAGLVNDLVARRRS